LLAGIISVRCLLLQSICQRRLSRCVTRHRCRQHARRSCVPAKVLQKLREGRALTYRFTRSGRRPLLQDGNLRLQGGGFAR
jgi:hypothetical protein